MSTTILKKLLSLMLKIRLAEEKIVEVYAKEQMIRTPTHLSIGQEAVSAGLCAVLEKEDQIFTGHRCHGAYLAKGGNYNEFFGELCGRTTGSSRGRAGSAHLTDVECGVFSSPILGAMMPVTVGAALSFKMDGKKNVAVSLFGDAAIEEGVFAESVNFAVTKRLPVLFVCENNLYSTHSPMSVRQPQSAIFERVAFKEFETFQIDGNNVVEVYETFSRLIKRLRHGEGPFFVECLTYRIREHVGPLFDYDRGYRTKEEVDTWLEKCPIKSFRKKLWEENILSDEDFILEEKKWKTLADEAYALALRSPWPDRSELLKYVY